MTNPTLFAVCPHDTARGIDKWAMLNTYVNKRLDLHGKFHVYLDFAEFGADLEKERFLWAYLNPADTLKVRARFGYVPIARPVARFDVAYLVRLAGRGVGDVADGARIAAVNGYLFFLVRHQLQSAGVSFQTVPAKSYAEVLSLLERGEADFGVTYNEHFDPLSAVVRERFEIVGQIHPGVSHVVAAHPSMSGASREAIRGLLLSAANDPEAAKLLADLKMTGFEAVPEAPFALLEEVMRTAAA